MVFDQNKCIGCGLCKRSCSETNHVPAGQLRMTLERQSPLDAAPGNRKYIRVSCQQCQDAPCVRVCPTGAACRDAKTGIVTMDESKCVGCKYCIAACPYNVRFINKETKVAENCDFCLKTKLSKGEDPACVAACRHDALIFGDVNDPNSYVGKLLAVKDTVRIRPHLGTDPSLRYIPIVKQGV
jgi:protein NrfC